MTIVYAILIVTVTIAFVILLVRLLRLPQPTWREILIRHCDEQHAALARGDLQLWIYGNYPPADLDRRPDPLPDGSYFPVEWELPANLDASDRGRIWMLSDGSSYIWTGEHFAKYLGAWDGSGYRI